jgi:hypothetical protein
LEATAKNAPAKIYMGKGIEKARNHLKNSAAANSTKKHSSQTLMILSIPY